MLDRFNQQRDFFQNMLREKYRQSNITTEANANQANAAAAVDKARAPMVAPLAQSQIAENNANAGYIGEQAKYFGPTAQANIRQSDAAADLNTSMAEQNRFKIDLGFLNDGDDNSLLGKSLSGLKSMGGGFGYKLKRGMTRVPGKGDGDKVPAMLEPGEAVLNKKAANMMGRDKIAAANAKGNQMRQKDAQSKVAKLLKQMGMV